MQAVLGIDPAWTVGQPSGVALLVLDEGEWRCHAIAPSYESFYDLAIGGSVDWDHQPAGGAPDIARLSSSVRQLVPNADIDVVAVDIPIAKRPFTSRRTADNLASKLLSRRGCAVHSPTVDRPGALSERFSDGFGVEGFDVFTGGTLGVGRRPLLEVYPHPAAMTLLDAPYRVPYKVAKTTRYWPDTSRAFRVSAILETWDLLLRALASSIVGIDLPVPSPSSTVRLSQLKRFEDAIDAVICAWVGVQFLRDECVALGDDDGAIWVPRGCLDRDASAVDGVQLNGAGRVTTRSNGVCLPSGPCREGSIAYDARLGGRPEWG